MTRHCDACSAAESDQNPLVRRNVRGVCEDAVVCESGCRNNRGTKMRLYDLSAQIRALLDSTDDGELTPEQLAALDALGLAMDHKVDSCCGLIREWESIISVRQAEIDRLNAGLDARKNSIQRMKDYLKNCLETVGEKRHETALFTIRTQKNPPAARCTVPVEELPDDFIRTKKEPNNAAAIEYWKANGIAPRGFDVQVGSHLRIA